MTVEILALLFLVMIVLTIILIIMVSKKGNNKESEMQIKHLEQIIKLQNQQIFDQLNRGKMESDNKFDNLLNTLDKKIASNYEVSSQTFKNVADSIDKKMNYQNEHYDQLIWLWSIRIYF